MRLLRSVLVLAVMAMLFAPAAIGAKVDVGGAERLTAAPLAPTGEIVTAVAPTPKVVKRVVLVTVLSAAAALVAAVAVGRSDAAPVRVEAPLALRSRRVRRRGPPPTVV